MAFVIADRVRETSTTTGVGTFSLLGAVDLCRTFVAGVGDGNTTRYVIEGAPGTNEYEIGEGVVTDLATDTLSRLTVIKSSNSNALVNFSAGTKNVFCDADKSYLQLPRFLARPTASQFLEAGEYAMVGVPMTWDAGIGLTMEAGAVLEARVPYAPPLVTAPPGGRLTLTSLTPVTTADVLAATTIYYTPYVSDWLPLYTASGGWQSRQFTERSIAVPVVASQMYDVFGYWSEGATGFAIEALAWTNDTTRATGLTLTNGLRTKTGDQTRLYLGSFRTTASVGQTEDSFGGGHQAGGKRFVWNMYNRRLRSIGVIDTTNSWNYTTATWRQANNNAGNQVAFVVGLSEDLVSARAAHMLVTAGAVGAATGIGLDVTNANSALVTSLGCTASLGAAFVLPLAAEYARFPGIGYHTLAWLEISAAAGTTTWYGDDNSAFGNSGLQALIMA